jgi:hypothetical protein
VVAQPLLERPVGIAILSVVDVDGGVRGRAWVARLRLPEVCVSFGGGGGGVGGGERAPACFWCEGFLYNVKDQRKNT